MDGLRGHSGWQWIFILEGVFTTVFGLLSFLVFPASPSTARFLTPQEREVYTQALADDWSGDDGKEKFSWSEWTNAIRTGKLVCDQQSRACPSIIEEMISTPTIVNALGQSPTRTQLLSVPPYACSFAFSITASWFSDKYKQRGTMAIITSLIAIVGYAMFLGSSSKHTDYGALFLQIIGAYSVPPALSTWQSNNLQPHYRRATAVAMGFMSSNIGAIVSTWIFVDPPRFRTASIINLSFSCVMAVSSAAAMVYFSMRNTAKRAEVVRLIGEKGMGTEPGGWDSKTERIRLGDRHPRFEYTL
ncbi:hypothetical protein EWM64_g2504 [Hericium alpestre]|uniref:Major facilitator superfamily (MFS) profile domain-containing protein n=1 Tax=Hericium alpestre TaxID=135208 RepID=A0A4Z0A545_9AGAM|nr:hypothetical protein EWM64_g2504 [Hericium alpestre]